MIVLVSLIVLLRGFPCFHDFSHGAPYIHLLNDFCTCIKHVGTALVVLIQTLSILLNPILAMNQPP